MYNEWKLVELKLKQKQSRERDSQNHKQNCNTKDSIQGMRELGLFKIDIKK